MTRLIIGRLLTDEAVRSRFLAHPAGTLSSLRDQGLDLTAMEADAMARTDRRFWKLGVDWIDAILHRSDEEPGNESCAVADASRIDAGQRK